MIYNKKKITLNMSKIRQNSNLSRAGSQSNSRSKEYERGKTAKALKKQRSSSKQSLSPIQKVDLYLAELERAGYNSTLKHQRMAPEQERNPNYTQQYQSGEILYKKLHRRLKSAKLSGNEPD